MLRRHWSVQFRAMVRMAQSCRQEQHNEVQLLLQSR